jgi:hypothetical protein
MALSLFSSGQDPASLLNTSGSGTGSFSTLTGKLTGSSAISGMNVGPIGSLTSVPGTTGTNLSLLDPGGGNLLQTEVTQTTSQPGTTPDANSAQSAITLNNDSYRSGKGTTGINGDDLSNPRTLGEADDNISSIFLSTNIPPDLNPNLFFDVNAQGNILNAYSEFFLQSVRESQTEKVQVVETFTDYYAFFFGKRPPVYTFSGTLLNDQNYKWTNDLMFFYDNFFRGTSSVQLGAQAYVNYDGRLVGGFLLNLNIQQNAELYKGALFSFDVLVITHQPIYFSSDVAGVIDQARAYLQSQKDKIQAQIAQITASVAPGQAALKALQATNGQSPANALSQLGVKLPTIPPSLTTPVGTLPTGF